MPAYKSMVQSHFEYCVQFWSPIFKKNVVELEKLQRRVANLITLLYTRSLKRLGLFSIQKRQLSGYMTEVYKVPRFL